MRTRLLFRWESLVVLVAIPMALWKMRAVDGWIGHDFYYSFIRIFIGATHFWRNGFTLPHYTPSLCGGIPFFADPQSPYFSLIQILSFFWDPLFSARLAIGVFYFLGYWGALKLFHSAMKLEVRASHLGALAWVLNGFSFAHLYVGHLTHHSFQLFPWLLYFLFRSQKTAREVSRSAAAFSLLLVYLFYSGSFHMLVVFSVCFVLFLPLLIHTKYEEGELRRCFQVFGGSLVILILTCSGKFAATLLFSRHFIQGPIDTSQVPMAPLFFKYFWFDPETTPLILKFGRWAFGPWEYVSFISRSCLPAFLVFVWAKFRRWDTPKIVLACAYAIVVPLVIVLGAGRLANERLWFFHRYHNPIKLWAAFIPLILVVFAHALSEIAQRFRFSAQWVGLLVYGLFAWILLAEFHVYSQYFRDNKVTLGYRHVPEHYDALKAQGGISRVDSVVPEPGVDITGLRTGCTSLRCYEPLFGYRGESLKVNLMAGSTAIVRDGKFNLNHPGCLLYPEHFGCRPWERISVGDGVNFERFVTGKEPDWGVPLWQSALYTLNFVSISLLITGLCVEGVRLPRFRVRAPLPGESPA